MSDDAKWILGISLSIILALIGVVWTFLRKESAATNRAIAKLEGRFEQWTKDKDAFDQQWRHGQYTDDITAINKDLWPLLNQAEAMKGEIEKLRAWRHLTVDPYIPKAVDSLKERVDWLHDWLQKRVNNQRGTE